MLQHFYFEDSSGGGGHIRIAIVSNWIENARKCALRLRVRGHVLRARVRVPRVRLYFCDNPSICYIYGKDQRQKVVENGLQQ